MPIDWVAKEVKMKSKFDYDLENFSLAEDHLFLWFRSEGDYDVVLKDGP